MNIPQEIKMVEYAVKALDKCPPQECKTSVEDWFHLIAVRCGSNPKYHTQLSCLLMFAWLNVNEHIEITDVEVLNTDI